MARDVRGSYNPITIKGNSGGNKENKLIKKNYRPYSTVYRGFKRSRQLV